MDILAVLPLLFERNLRHFHLVTQCWAFHRTTTLWRQSASCRCCIPIRLARGNHARHDQTLSWSRWNYEQIRMRTYPVIRSEFRFEVIRWGTLITIWTPRRFAKSHDIAYWAFLRMCFNYHDLVCIVLLTVFWWIELLRVKSLTATFFRTLDFFLWSDFRHDANPLYAVCYGCNSTETIWPRITKFYAFIDVSMIDCLTNLPDTTSLTASSQLQIGYE